MSVSKITPVDFPPSNQKYKKNGKKVKANIGALGSGILVTGTALPIGISYYKDIMSEKLHIERIRNDIEKYHNDSKFVEKSEKAIEEIQKGIKKTKTKGWLTTLAVAALMVGVIILTNHNRNKKREQLYNEPMQQVNCVA